MLSHCPADTRLTSLMHTFAFWAPFIEHCYHLLLKHAAYWFFSNALKVAYYMDQDVSVVIHVTGALI